MNDSIAHISFSFFWQLDIHKELEDLDYLSPLFFFFLIYLLFLNTPHSQQIKRNYGW